MKERIDLEKLPEHIAIIMDGNGRWAKKKGAARVFGHKNAIKAVRDVTEGCAELGIKYLTLYAFSTENWSRPKAEINALMQLLVGTIRSEISTLMENNVRLATIGDTNSLPGKCQKELREAMEITAANSRMTLVLALSYSGRWDILKAAKQLARDVAEGVVTLENINQAAFEKYLNTSGIPDPELLIRTSGEERISNFLLWQMAYTELYMTDMLWPDFRRENLYEAIVSYQRRERRFGKISEQLNQG